jgi:hypothetical protein
MRFTLGVLALTLSSAARAQVPWDSVGHILKSRPVAQAGYTRFNFPRTDLTIQVGEVTLRPAMASTSWVGFAGTADHAVAMGDLVTTLLETGVVTQGLTEEGIEFLAIHNHLAGSRPNVTYIHFHGTGSAYALAASLDRVLGRTRTPRPVMTPPAESLAIDTARVFRALGQSGRASGEVAQAGFQFVPGTVTMNGETLVPALAYGSPIAIQMISPTRAVATGDFSVPESKVGAVRSTLVTNNITPTAMHTHLVGETPRIYYIHFWAEGPLDSVLQGLRRTIDAAR